MKKNIQSSSRKNKKQTLKNLADDFKVLYSKIIAHHAKHKFDSLTQEEIVLFDAKNYPDAERQKAYNIGRDYYTQLMAMKVKDLELRGLINVGATEKGDLVFEPGPNYKPEVVTADQRPATALEIAEANRPDAGVAALQSLVAKVVPHLKRV